MHDLGSFFARVNNIFQTPLLPIGKSSVSLYHLIYISILFVLLVWATDWAKRWIESRLLSRTNFDAGMRQTVSSLGRGIVLTVGFVVILQTAGIDLSSIAVIAGALGLGISFGLQQITSNFVAGVALLLERPIKIGDRIEVDGVSGEVVKISLRATTMMTNDNISIIVPNADFMKGKITNWSYSSDMVRFNFPVPVDRAAVPQTVINVLEEVAKSHPGVLQEPPPDVVFQEYGEKANTYILRVYTKDYLGKPSSLRSELNLAIYKAFEKNNIAIGFGPVTTIDGITVSKPAPAPAISVNPSVEISKKT